jgi:hypothetical protein
MPNKLIAAKSPHAAIRSIQYSIEKVEEHKRRATDEFNSAIMSQANLIKHYNDQLDELYAALDKLRPVTECDPQQGSDGAQAFACGGEVGDY